MRLPFVPGGLPVKAWPPALAARGPGWRSALHAHHAMHLVLALEGELRVRGSPNGRWSRAAGLLTAPDSPHAVDARGVQMVVTFFDPESSAAAALRPALEGPIRLIAAIERDALVRALDPRSFVRADAEEWARGVARILGLAPPDSKRIIHPLVRKLLVRLRNAGVDDRVSLEALAEVVGLSPGRLMHVFTESVGIPLRPYLAWLRVERAATAIVSGASLSDAALLAGFADAPHMSRTFRRTLGIAPSFLRPLQCNAQLARATRMGEG
jgi:AraC-like DNA-binding protein